MAKYYTNTIINCADDITVGPFCRPDHRQQWGSLSGGGQRPGSVVPGQQPLPQREQEKFDDCRQQEKEAEHALIHIDGAVVERVESFKFLGVHTTN